MQIENLIVNNFGVYNGRQDFNLLTGKKKPVILIGALNGSGKTTFLQAIDFVLYGKQSNIFQTQKLSYDNFLKKNINRENYKEGAHIELVFQRKFKGKKQKFKISRSWKPNGIKMKEDFYVFVNDIHDEDITKDWDNFVDQILPARVASLFFFDGEKIEQLADLDKSKEVLKKAINSLLGLEIVEQLNLDVEEFKRRSMLELKSDAEKKSILNLEEKANEFKNNIKLIEDEKVKAQDEMAKLRFEIKELDIKLSKKGINYYEKRQDFLNKQNELESKKALHNEELIKFASGDAPLLLLEKELNEILEQSKSQREILNKKEIIKSSNELINNIKDFVENNSSDKNFNSKINEYLNSQIQTQQKTSQNLHVQANLNYEDIHLLLNKEFDLCKKNINQNLSSIEKFNEEYEKLSQLINKIPTNEEIQPLIDKQNLLKKELADQQIKLNVLEDRRGQQNGPLMKINAEIKQAYQQKSEKDLINLDKKRFVSYSEKVKQIISAFHANVLNYHIKRLEKLILESFNLIHRKKDLVKKIQINTSSFDIKIFAKNNNEIDTDKLSAGERQLFAVAILWGLAKASNSSAPTIIDTPLGRLDSEHRLNLVEKYFPNAADQVILLSTDEEINQKYHKYIKPYLSRSYKVEYDQKINGSKSSEGYFF